MTSRLTSQGQISIPAAVRRKLGLGPGSSIEWLERDGEFVVRRAGVACSADIHAALFGGKSPAAVRNVKAAVRLAVRKRHARH